MMETIKTIDAMDAIDAIDAIVSYPLFFIYVKDQEIQQVICDALIMGTGGGDAVQLLGKLDRAKTTASGGRYRFTEAVKLDFDVSLNDLEDTKQFLDENDDDILREYFKPVNLLQNDPVVFSGGENMVSSIFFFFQEIYGGTKTRIHLDENELGDKFELEEVEIKDVNDLRKTRNYLGFLSAVAKKARNRTRHFRGNL